MKFKEYAGRAGTYAAKGLKNAALPVATLAGSGLAWLLTKDHPNNYLASIAPMAVLSLGMGETARRAYENNMGRPLRWYENAISFGFGATVAAAGYELCENANKVAGALPQGGFPSQDRVDAQYVGPFMTGARLAFDAGKNAFKKSGKAPANGSGTHQNRANKL